MGHAHGHVLGSAGLSKKNVQQREMLGWAKPVRGITGKLVPPDLTRNSLLPRIENKCRRFSAYFVLSCIISLTLISNRRE
jgi:hypothetical protein